MSDRITIHDCLDCGYCVTGVRAKCRLLGADFRSFVREGISMEEAEKFDDAMIQNVVRHKRGAQT